VEFDAPRGIVPTYVGPRSMGVIPNDEHIATDRYEPGVCKTAMVEILVRPTMYFSISFALGLLAYLRQAALSLHRAPTSKAMRSYYESHGLPPPARVAAHIDAPAQPRASMVANLLQRFFETPSLLVRPN
jgi:hypothetical protein